MSENIEQKIKLTFENNAEENSKDVNKLTASIDKTKDAQENTVKENTKVENSFKSLRVQLREATVEQQRLSAQYGATSKEAIGATKAVAKLKDEMEFQKELVKSYNPDEKFRGLTQTAGIAALALGGVSDGFKALGIESKGLDQVLGSAQAILGVTSAVAGMSDAYQILTVSKKAKAAADVVEATTTEVVAATTTQATAATWKWNTALLANPIVLITAGIVAAIAVVYAFVKITGDAATAEEKAKVASMQLTKAIDNQSKSFENQNSFLSKNNDHKIALLKASGASEAQIYKETKALAEQELQLAKNYRAEALLLEQKAYEANRDNPTEFNAKTLADAKENIVKAEKAVSVGYDGLIALQQSHEVAVVQAQTDAKNKAADAAQKARDEEAAKVKAARAKELEDLKTFHADVLRVQGEMNVAKVEQETQDRLDETERLQTQQEETSANIDALEESNAKVKDKEKADDQALVDQKAKNKDDILATGDALIAGAQMLAGKNKQLQKAAIIAEGAMSLGKVGVNIATGVSKDAASGAVASVPMIIKTIATGALSAAAIISNTSRALKAVGGGGSGLSDGGRQSASTGASATPQVNFQASKENQIGNTLAGRLNEQAPIRVTVLENDITKVQANVQAKVVSNSF